MWLRIICCYPAGCAGSEGNMSVLIQMKTATRKDFSAVIAFCIVLKCGKKVNVKKLDATQENLEQPVGFAEFISCEDIARLNVMLKDELTIVCDVRRFKIDAAARFNEIPYSWLCLHPRWIQRPPRIILPSASRRSSRRERFPTSAWPQGITRN